MKCIGPRGASPASTKDPLKAFLLMLGDTEYRVIVEVKALSRGVATNQKLGGGDHAGMGDEVEETGNILLEEDKVVGGVEVLKQVPNVTK